MRCGVWKNLRQSRLMDLVVAAAIVTAVALTREDDSNEANQG
jgi:hypothetical protein